MGYDEYTPGLMGQISMCIAWFVDTQIHRSADSPLIWLHMENGKHVPASPGVFPVLEVREGRRGEEKGEERVGGQGRSGDEGE